MQGVVDKDGIGDEAQAACVVHNFEVVTGAKLSPVAEENMPCYAIACFSAIQL